MQATGQLRTSMTWQHSARHQLIRRYFLQTVGLLLVSSRGFQSTAQIRVSFRLGHSAGCNTTRHYNSTHSMRDMKLQWRATLTFRGPKT